MEYSFQKGRARLARRTPARMAGRQVKGLTGTARTLAAPSRHARRRSRVALAFGFGSRFGRDLFIFGHRSGVASRSGFNGRGVFGDRSGRFFSNRSGGLLVTVP